jgi:hypothetical protein
MRSFPPELIYFLIFAAIFLFQYLMKLAARQSAQQGRQPETGVPELPFPSSYEVARVEPAWPGPRAPGDDFGRRPEQRVAVRQRPRRRFSRQSLFGTRRDVQNAVVIATILGPCRALEPSGETPSMPRGRTAR